jgi:hypothetical protein
MRYKSQLGIDKGSEDFRAALVFFPDNKQSIELVSFHLLKYSELIKINIFFPVPSSFFLVL